MLGVQALLHELCDLPQFPALGRTGDRVLRAGSGSTAARRRRDPAVLGRRPGGARRRHGAGRQRIPFRRWFDRTSTKARLRPGRRRAGPIAHRARRGLPDRREDADRPRRGRSREPLGRPRPGQLADPARLALATTPIGPRIARCEQPGGATASVSASVVAGSASGVVWVWASVVGSVVASGSASGPGSGSAWAPGSGSASARDPSRSRS